MDKDLVSGSLGSEGKYDVAFVGGQLVVSVSAQVSLASAEVSVKVGAKQVLDALKAAIPGTLDDAVIGAIEAALGL